MVHKTNIVLLLTGTVHVQNKHFTALNNADQRRKEYVETVRYYLQRYDFRIVFVENSGEDLTREMAGELQSGRLEMLTFNGNNYAADLGKGPGEMNCIEYAIENSRFLAEDCFVFKITGRYRISNLPDFVGMLQNEPTLDLLADLTNNFRFSSAAIFGFRPFFAKKYLFKNRHLLNDTKGFYFEHALAKAVLEAIGDHVNFRLFKHYPRVVAISGTTGKPYKRSFLYMLPRRLKYWVRYFIVNR